YPGHPGDQMSQPDTYTFAVLLAGLAFLGVRMFLASGFGRVITAIRENELRTELLGYDVRRAQVIVFPLGGAVAGLAGGLAAGPGTCWPGPSHAQPRRRARPRLAPTSGPPAGGESSRRSDSSRCSAA